MSEAPKRSRGRPKAFNPAPEQTTIQALDRALVILRALASAEGGQSLTEIAEATDQAPATVYRALSTFARHGIVETQETTQLWFIGQEAFRIGNAFLGRSGLVEYARRVMRELMAETGETANLAVADGAQVIFLSQIETHHPIRAFFPPGTRGPIHASGIGKALLAHYPPRELDRLVGVGPFEAYTPRTITGRAALEADLAAIRARGWAVDDEERTEGMRCVAAPIFNEFREAVAGVSISGPTVRVTPDRAEAIGAAVRAAADRVTLATGGIPA
ncbi:HTH-type transcriptional regulator BhcR [Amaricoccus sp. W119]|uniref:HTH-type transcriptional regulator BhcR n=1 Tax=Amaricoccus sp. W119 TaxID=3391833 RepID=UPI0039A645DF